MMTKKKKIQKLKWAKKRLEGNFYLGVCDALNDPPDMPSESFAREVIRHLPPRRYDYLDNEEKGSFFLLEEK